MHKRLMLSSAAFNLQQYACKSNAGSWNDLQLLYLCFYFHFFWSLHFKGKLQSICLNSRDKREAIEVGPEGILFI